MFPVTSFWKIGSVGRNSFFFWHRKWNPENYHVFSKSGSVISFKNGKCAICNVFEAPAVQISWILTYLEYLLTLIKCFTGFLCKRKQERKNIMSFIRSLCQKQGRLIIFFFFFFGRSNKKVRVGAKKQGRSGYRKHGVFFLGLRHFDWILIMIRR